MHYGSLIYNTFLSDKSCILGNLNVAWVDPTELKSGEKIYALLKAIQETIFASRAKELTRGSVKQNEMKLPKSMKRSPEQVQESINLKTEENPRFLLSDREWYPESWLPFIAYGAPAGSKQ